jgi:hypothetical protein
MSPNKAAGIATLVLLLSALLSAYSIINPVLGDMLLPATLLGGSLAAGLLYALAWGWKGLAMCIAIAFTYTAAGFVVIMIMFRLPQAQGFGALLGGAAILVLFSGNSLFFSLIGGVVGAVLRGVVGAILHRRHKRPR